MKRLAVLLLMAGLVSVSQADWTLLDNFDSYDNSSSTQTDVASGGVWSVDDAGSGNSNIVDIAGGQALQTFGGSAWSGAKRDISGTGAAVAVDEVQTYFWQVQCSYGGDMGIGDWVYDFMMGLSPDVSYIDQNNAWSDFGVMPFINNAPSTPYINANAPTEPWWALMSPETWTNVWVVINNDATAPTYDLYYSTGTDAAVLVAANAIWRGSETWDAPAVVPGVDLNAIGFMAAGWADTTFLVDNIYYAAGENLANPVPEPATLALLGLGAVALLRKRR